MGNAVPGPAALVALSSAPAPAPLPHWEWAEPDIVAERTGLRLDYGAEWRAASRRTRGWHWIEPGSRPWDPQRWCDAHADVLMVGDSLMMHTFYTLALQLGAIDTIPRPPGASAYNMSIAVCGGTSHVHYVRNDWLELNDGPVLRDGHDVRTPWKHLVSHFDIIMVNQGAHMLPWSDYRKNVRKTLRFLSKTSARVFYLGMSPGFPHCEREKEPRSPGHEPDLRHAPHNWSVIPLYNEDTRRFIEREFGPTRCVRYIDLASAAMLRGDAHVGAHDCLHFKFPGVHDAWIHIIYNEIFFM